MAQGNVDPLLGLAVVFMAITLILIAFRAGFVKADKDSKIEKAKIDTTDTSDTSDTVKETDTDENDVDHS